MLSVRLGHKRGAGKCPLSECYSKYSELSYNRAINLHLHNIQIIAEPAFKDEGLALVVHITVLTEEADFGAMPCEVGNQEQVAVEVQDI
jgi:hypothetical protein